MSNKNIKSHIIEEKENGFDIIYNKSYFKINKFNLFFFLFLYIGSAGIFMYFVIHNNGMTFVLFLKLFLSFILSTFSILSLSKEVNVEKKKKIKKESYLINKYNISFIEDKNISKQYKVKDIENISKEEKNINIKLNNGEEFKLPFYPEDQKLYFKYLNQF